MTFLKRPITGEPILTEYDLGKAMRAMAKREGHKPKPFAETGKGNKKDTTLGTRVRAFLSDGEWRSYDEIAEATGGHKTSIANTFSMLRGTDTYERKLIPYEKDGYFGRTVKWRLVK